MPAVAPEILIWARETAGFTVDEAARRLQISDARGSTARERLSAMEAGQAQVSRATLVKMTTLYHRPLLTFYLAAPPRAGDRGEDFRTLPDRHTDAEPLIDALIRDVRARQSMVRSLLDDEDAQPLPFVGGISITAGPDAVVADIQRRIGFDADSFRAEPKVEAAFNALRAKVEAAGVFVLLIGNLGSHHTAIDAGAFRGLALADPVAPFIVINDQDAKSAWSFTLLHELAHLWIGAGGVSGPHVDGRVEQFCNDVASRFLLPARDLAMVAIDRQMDLDDVAFRVESFADERRISRSLVIYRLFRDNRLSEVDWQTLSDRFRTEWRQHRAAQRDETRQDNGGPNYYTVRRHRIGAALLRLVERTLSEGSLTPTKAGKVLGVKPRNVIPLLRNTAASGRAG